MSKQTFKTHLYFVKYEHDAEGHFTQYAGSADMGKGCPEWTYVKEIEFEVDVPDDFDPRPAQIAALREQRLEAQAKLSKTVTDIDHRIQSLLAIEMVAS